MGPTADESVSGAKEYRLLGPLRMLKRGKKVENISSGLYSEASTQYGSSVFRKPLLSFHHDHVLRQCKQRTSM